MPKPAPHAPTPAEAAAEAQRLGFALAPEQAAKLAQYLTLLLKWSRAMNLVGRTTWPDVFRELAADSLHLAGFLRGLGLPPEPLSLDLGAGAGLPGIPLRTLWGAGDYVLVELREKRAVFLRQAVAELALPGVRVVHGRAEELGPELERLGLRPKADLVLSRAFLPWPQLLPLAAGLLAPGGRLVVLSNDPAPQEPGGGFALEACLAYAAQASGRERVRYFWSLTPASC